MQYNHYQDFCQALPATSHVVQWHGSDVWKVGGKVFAIGRWQAQEPATISFRASEHNFAVLQHQPGFRPAPYLASRGLKWLQIHDLNAITLDELQYYLRESHRIIAQGLSKKRQKELGLNQEQYLSDSPRIAKSLSGTDF